MTDAQTELMEAAHEQEKAADAERELRLAKEMLAAQSGRADIPDPKTSGPHDTNPLARQVGGTHYKGFAIQPVEFFHANGILFIEACIIKYVCRHREKGGQEDLKKARHFLDILEQLEYGHRG